MVEKITSITARPLYVSETSNSPRKEWKTPFITCLTCGKQSGSSTTAVSFKKKNHQHQHQRNHAATLKVQSVNTFIEVHPRSLVKVICLSFPTECERSRLLLLVSCSLSASQLLASCHPAAPCMNVCRCTPTAELSPLLWRHQKVLVVLFQFPFRPFFFPVSSLQLSSAALRLHTGKKRTRDKHVGSKWPFICCLVVVEHRPPQAPRGDHSRSNAAINATLYKTLVCLPAGCAWFVVYF